MIYAHIATEKGDDARKENAAGIAHPGGILAYLILDHLFRNARLRLQTAAAILVAGGDELAEQRMRL
jgi:hypothetical protein